MPGWRASTLLVLAAASLTGGCGEPQPTRAVVRGKVTFQNKPVEFGDIVFQPLDEKWKKFYAQGEVVNGEYELTINGPIVGENRVEVFGYKRTGRKRIDTDSKPLSEPVEVIEEVVPYIPPQFNEASELRCTINPGENNDVNFDL